MNECLSAIPFVSARGVSQATHAVFIPYHHEFKLSNLPLGVNFEKNNLKCMVKKYYFYRDHVSRFQKVSLLL